jgi:non-ribosomal peptide synthetase component F
MATPNEYIPGQVVVLTDLITDPNSTPTPNTPIDDNTDAVTVYKPDGTTSTPSVSHSGASGSGTYKAQLTVDQAGWWEYVFRSTGNPGAGAGRGRFYVSPVP